MTALNHNMLQPDLTNSNRRHSFGAFASSSSASLNAPYAGPQPSRTSSANATALLRHSTSMTSTTSNAGGPMRRSHSKSALFNEDVLEVSLLKSPARKTNIRTPYQPGVQGVLSDGVQAHMQAQQQVAILDRLQARQLFVNVNQAYVVKSTRCSNII
jgi:hypothetical protein